MGGTLLILSDRTVRDAQSYLSYLNREKPRIVFLIPSVYKALGSALQPSVRSVFLGGERSEDLREGRYAVNIYSATEIGYVCPFCCALTRCASVRTLCQRQRRKRSGFILRC